jgi:hypothetical protein
MDASAFGVSWEVEAAAHQAARVESSATIFASVFSADGAQLISGALPPAQRRRDGFSSLLLCVCLSVWAKWRTLSLQCNALRRVAAPPWPQVPAQGV